MAESNGYMVNTTFDPFSQQFDILAPDGQTPITLDLADIIKLQTLVTAQGIIFGVQIGLCALLLTILMLRTKSDKRRSPVFLLNAAALLLLLVRNIVNCVEFTTMFFNFYNMELYYYPTGPSLRHAMSISTTAEILGFFVNFFVYASMILQIHIVCCTLQRWQQKFVVLGCCFLALVTLAIRLTLSVLNIKWLILGINTAEQWQIDVIFSRLSLANNIFTVVTIGLYSCIFIVKLALAMVLRRKLHMKQFGPIQIIFIMGCQTLFVPVIFAIITYYAVPGSLLNSFVPTIVAVFLPLSGMWASANTANQKLADDSKCLPVGGNDLASAKAYVAFSDDSRTKVSDSTQASTLVGDHEFFLMSGGTVDDRKMSEVDDPEKQMQSVHDGHVIDVSRTFSIRSGRPI